MVVALKRKRGPISYKEPSSDDESSDSSSQTRPTRRNRTAPVRRSSRHHASGDEVEEHAPIPQPRQRPSRPTQRTRRQGRQPASYKDISSDEEEDPDGDFLEPETVKSATSQLHRKIPYRSPRGPPSQIKKSTLKRRLALGAPLKPKEPLTEPLPPPILSDGRIPPWETLPYHVLLQIFVYASHPLHDENMKPTASISWLAQTARICPAFAKPALTALYRNPPIFAMRPTRKDLVYCLINQPATTSQKYQVMPKRLEIDATQMSALTDPTHSVSDLVSLVKSLSTLRDIDIFDPIDRPPFRDRLRRLRKWVYPKELFGALQASALRLISWRWNSTFCEHGLLWLKDIHTEKAFQSLREVSLVKFHPDPEKPERESSAEPSNMPTEPTAEELLGSALAVLPNLRALSFETCGVVSGRLLPLLPNNLSVLSIINCGELLSDALSAFLATHGAQLEHLVLNHNQSLNLSFLVDLKASCPKLEVLRMDAAYYSSLSMSRDNEPLYDCLLGEDEVPTWPSSLRIIDMEYLRNWDSAAATNFFSSLIDSAEDLPWLREITIMAMVDTDWRQRAAFRQKWTAKFKRVFARPWVLPSPHLVSLKAFREWKARNDAPKDAEVVLQTPSAVVVESANADESDSDAPLLHRSTAKKAEHWNPKRLRSRSKATGSYDEASENDTSDQSPGNAAAADGDESITFVQGRCHTVIFRIDNFRPREEIFDEADFLDAEPSGDEEWNEGNEGADDEGGYAW